MAISTIEAASWRIATEVCRRSPELRIRQMHPGGGQYDCLALVHPEGNTVAHLNRHGSFHVFCRLDGQMVDSPPRDIWAELASLDARVLVEEVRRGIGQRSDGPLPSSKPHVLAYRFIAALVGMHAFAKDQWKCVSAAHDSSGGEGCFVNSEAHLFGPLSRELTTLPENRRFWKAAEWWVISKNDEPLLCLSEGGNGTTRAGDEFNLPAMYAKARRLAPIIWELVAEHIEP